MARELEMATAKDVDVSMKQESLIFDQDTRDRLEIAYPLGELASSKKAHYHTLNS